MNKQVLFKSLLLVGFLISSTPVTEAKRAVEMRNSSNVSSDRGIQEVQLKSGGTQLGVRLDGPRLSRAGTQLGDR
jgi:hypothetical protein